MSKAQELIESLIEGPTRDFGIRLNFNQGGEDRLSPTTTSYSPKREWDIVVNGKKVGTLYGAGALFRGGKPRDETYHFRTLSGLQIGSAMKNPTKVLDFALFDMA